MPPLPNLDHWDNKELQKMLMSLARDKLDAPPPCKGNICHDRITKRQCLSFDLTSATSPFRSNPILPHNSDHTHKPITLSTIQNSAHLVEILKSTTSAIALPIQTAALRTFNNMSNEYDIQAFFDIFDDIFFLGSLKENTRMGIHDSRPHDHIRASCMDTTSYGKTTCLITAKKQFLDDTLQYVEVLLHEMVHAYMALYACRTENCHARPENIGVSGHGEA